MDNDTSSKTLSTPQLIYKIRHADFPANYVAAVQALEQCVAIDELKDCADKMQAIWSYARQSKDDTLLFYARRIQLRAIRRLGDVLAEIPSAQGTRTDIELGGGAPTKLTRKAAAKGAGLSRDQMIQALRVAKVTKEAFEALVESDDPPTVTALARKAINDRRSAWLHENAPWEYSRWLKGPKDPLPEADLIEVSRLTLEHVARFVTMIHEVNPVDVVRGAHTKDLRKVQKLARILERWAVELGNAAGCRIHGFVGLDEIERPDDPASPESKVDAFVIQREGEAGTGAALDS